MLAAVVQSGVLRDDPFVLVDVGCGLGIDNAWRLFEPHLRVHAFDPQIAEIERLARAERNEHVHYHAGFVGLPEGHPFLGRRDVESARDILFNPWPRLSTAQALAAAADAAGPTDLEETNDWTARTLADEKIDLGSFFSANGLTTVDFVKSDTDGGDFEVLTSLEHAIEPLRILGFMIETPYTGSDAETTHTFHNVDRTFRRHGFQLATLSVNRYSRAALPAPFTHSILAQTAWGQAMWGDVVYLRDGIGSTDLTATKLLKLACIAELYKMPDVAAEILVERRAELAPHVPVNELLNLLTPPLGNRRVSYTEYVAAFNADPTSFYPGRDSTPDEEPATIRRGFLERAAGRLRRYVAAVARGLHRRGVPT
jgi:hypothetical protein